MDLIDAIRREWPVISGAPWSFAIAVIVVVIALSALIYGAMQWRYSAILEQQDHELASYRQKDKLGLASPTDQSSEANRAITAGSLVPVSGKNFVNQRVLLDGFAYSDCRFQNVTFVTNGENFSLAHNTFINRPVMSTDDPRIKSAFMVLAKMDLLKLPIVDENGNVITPGVTFVEGPAAPLEKK